MTNSKRLAKVRQRLSDWLAQQTVEAGEDSSAQVTGESITGESILIVDGFYAGRRFDAGQYHAIWFMEEDELKIHGPGGELLEVCTTDQIEDVKRPAASGPQIADSQASDVISLQDGDAGGSRDHVRRAA